MVRVAAILGLLLFLAGCAGYRVAQKPPARLKGTQKPYVVNGQRYEPLSSHENFVQEGMASWYGRDFHGKLTSNGEKYDMYAMTAAHKTLPLGVYVKVYNLANGHDTVVRVNDRGPFVKGRIIDLSYAAAKKLGVVESGTAPVRVEAIGYDPSPVKTVASRAQYEVGSYTIQLGAFSNYENAKRLARELKESVGYSSIRATQSQNSQLYRVFAGRYSSLKLAEAARENLEHKGYHDGFVIADDGNGGTDQ